MRCKAHDHFRKSRDISYLRPSYRRLHGQRSDATCSDSAVFHYLGPRRRARGRFAPARGNAALIRNAFLATVTAACHYCSRSGRRHACEARRALRLDVKCASTAKSCKRAEWLTAPLDGWFSARCAAFRRQVRSIGQPSGDGSGG